MGLPDRPGLAATLIACMVAISAPTRVRGAGPDPLYALAVSPDGAIAATGGKGGVVTIRELKAEGRRWTLDVGQTVHALAFASGGRVLAAGCGDDRVRLWDIRGKQSIPGKVLPCKGPVLTVASSPDGKTLAAGVEGSGTIHLFDVASGRPRGTLWEPANMISSLAFAPDGTSLASAGVNFKLWDVRPETLRPIETDRSDLTIEELRANGKRALLWESTSDPEYASGIAVSRDGKRLATVNGVGGPNAGGKTLSLWDASTKSRLRKVASEGLTTVVFAPDGGEVITGSDDGTIRVWDVASGELRKHWKAHTRAIRSIAILPHSGDLATVSDDGAFRVWGRETGELKPPGEGDR